MSGDDASGANRASRVLRAVVLDVFKDDVQGFRAFLVGIVGEEVVTRVPWHAYPMNTLVFLGLEEAFKMQTLDETAIARALARQRPQHALEILAWASARQQAPGEYAVELVHCASSNRNNVVAAMARCLRIDRALALKLIDRAPWVIERGLSPADARRIGAALTPCGALISYHSPAGGVWLPRIRRTPACGIVLAELPSAEATALHIMTTPVTCALYAQVTGHSAHQHELMLPARRVSHDDAARFCERLSALEAKTGMMFRVPTESEWTYAARADQKSRYPGSDKWAEVAWAKLSEPQPVGGLAPNAWGLHDMAGNVWEWTVPDSGDATVPEGHGVLKGGAYDSQESELTPEARRLMRSSDRDQRAGLRVCAMGHWGRA